MANAPKHALVVEPEKSDIDIDAPRKRRLWIIPIVLIGIVAAAYIGGSVYFMSHFLPSTTVDGFDVSLQEPQVLAEHIEQESAEYKGTFTGDGFEIPFTAADIDFVYDGEAYAEEAISQQNPWTWPLEFQNTHTLSATPVATFDAAKAWDLFAPVVEQGKAKFAELPHHGILFDEESDHYIVSDEAHTAMLDQKAIVAKAEAGIDAEATTIEIGEDCYKIDPETQAILDAANFYADAKVHLTLNGIDGYDITGKQISQWIIINDDGTVTLDEQAILDWGPGGLSDILDTVGKPRTYTRHDGEEITVPGGGSYGWLINGAESSKLILEAIKSGKPQTVDLPTYENAAKVDPGKQDWPDRYIDVDISEQHARMYDDNGELIWEADLVTGLPTPDRETPIGVFYITEKETDVKLFNRGTPIEGEGKDDPNWYNPNDGWLSHVTYWMGYDGSARGFHDAAGWRYDSEYGGDTYLWDGSHGCINMSYDNAEKLFNLCQVGDAVVIHE